MERKTLFLDFDGVLFDTLREVYLINRFIYTKKSVFEEVDNDNYTLYSKYKYLVYNIWMFYYYNPLIFDGSKDVVEDFSKAILNRNKTLEDKFITRFLEARYDLAHNHFEFWKNLEVPYKFFYKVKEFYEKGADIVIVSKKNKKSILERFETYDFKLPSDKIFAREILDTYMSKGDFIEQYMNKNNIKEAVFVDDNINNLIYTKGNVKTICALWGNTDPTTKGMTQEEAIKYIEAWL